MTARARVADDTEPLTGAARLEALPVGFLLGDMAREHRDIATRP